MDASWNILAMLNWPWKADNVTAWAAVLSTAFVGASVLFMALQLKHSRDEALAKSKREDETDELVYRPYVVVDLTFNRRHLAHIKISNVGKTPALNLRFAFDPPLRSSTRPDDGSSGAPPHSYALWDGIPVVPPGKTVQVLFDFGGSRFSTKATGDPLPDCHVATVTYDSAVRPGKSYTDTWPLDFAWRWNWPASEDKDLHDLVEAVEKIKTNA